MTLEQLADSPWVAVIGCIAPERHQQRFLRETQAVVGEHQNMPVAVVFEVIVNAFLLAQPLQQGQVGFFVLNAKRSQRIVVMGQFEAIAVIG